MLPPERRLTPMLQQYVAAKEQCPDALLFFRMGDFFELFFDDAKTVARELDLTLTARDKSDDPIPMAGVPHHAVTGYISRLLERGYSVALCDQIEDPRQAKGLVKRAITRLITPGTTTDLESLDPGLANYVAAVEATTHGTDDACTVAFLDLLAGELLQTHTSYTCLADGLRRMNVREVICADDQLAHIKQCLADDPIACKSFCPADACGMGDDARAQAFLEQRFGCGYIEGAQSGGHRADRQALVRVIAYAEHTQRRRISHLQPPRVFRGDDAMMIDEATRRNLELCQTQATGKKQGSLIWHLDRCGTPMGKRVLMQWMLFPLRSLSHIGARHDAVAALVERRVARESLMQTLAQVRDIERITGRLAMERAGPKDLGLLRDSLAHVPTLRAHMDDVAPDPGQQSHTTESQKATTPRLWARWRAYTDTHVLCQLARQLEAAMTAVPPAQSCDGGIFARGYCAELDSLLTLSTQGHEFIADLERRERERTGIANLKVRYNRVFGYYIEITNANLAQVPADYLRKQTLVNAERFITGELKEFEEKVLHADELRKERESTLFAQLCREVVSHIQELRALARLVAQTDALAALSQVAQEGRYVRPTLCRAPEISLCEARHPVLERLCPQGERFVPNDLELDGGEARLMLVTGPNMAGKSTVMRQAALCVLLAHIGSFVPATQARIGLCDRLFTRVGASDALGRGHSTFYG